MLVTSVSFFNEVATEMQKLSSETSVSFFNEVAAETQKTILKWFHFLMSLKSKTMLKDLCFIF